MVISVHYVHCNQLCVSGTAFHQTLLPGVVNVVPGACSCIVMLTTHEDALLVHSKHVWTVNTVAIGMWTVSRGRVLPASQPFFCSTPYTHQQTVCAPWVKRGQVSSGEICEIKRTATYGPSLDLLKEVV